MAHGIAGSAIAVSVGGSSINIKVTSWEATMRSNTVSDRGAGEAFESRLSTHGDWEASFEGIIPDATARHVLSANEALFGTAAAIALKEKSSDTNPVFSGTGIYDELRFGGDINSPLTARGHVVCSEGVAPTIDTTPLT